MYIQENSWGSISVNDTYIYIHITTMVAWLVGFRFEVAIPLRLAAQQYLGISGAWPVSFQGMFSR